MRTNRAIWLAVCLLSLGVAAEAASVKMKSGAVIEGDVQGIIVGKKINPNGDIVFIIFKCEDIQAIDERGVSARRAAMRTGRPVPGITMFPDYRIAEKIATEDTQIWYDRNYPSGPIPEGRPAEIPLIGELQLGKDGAESKLLPRIRIKTTKGEITLKLDEVMGFTEAAK